MSTNNTISSSFFLEMVEPTLERAYDFYGWLELC